MAVEFYGIKDPSDERAPNLDTSQFKLGTDDEIANDPRFNTPIPPERQKEYDAWKQKNSPNDSGYDYDLQGAFMAGMSRDSETQHFDDQFKKPNHPTFSTFSQYAKDAPDRAGTWNNDAYIPAVPKASKAQYYGLPEDDPAAKPPDPEAAKLSWGEEAWNTVLGAGTGVTTGVEAAGALLELIAPETGEYLRQKGISASQYLTDKMDPQYQASINKSWMSMGEDAAWKDPRAWVVGVASQIPYMIGTLGTGEGIALGARAAAGLEQAFARKVGVTTAAAGAGAGEASAGAGRATDAAGLSEEDRLKAMRIAAPFGAAAGAVLGHTVEHLTSGAAGGIIGKVASGAVSEAVEEGGTQVGTETGKASVGLGFDVGAVGEAATAGAMLGGPVGAALGKVGDRAKSKEEKLAAKATADKAAADAAEQGAINAELNRIRENMSPKQLQYWGKDPGATPTDDGKFTAPASASADADPSNLETYKSGLEAANKNLSALNDTIQQINDPDQRKLFVEQYQQEFRRRGNLQQKLDQNFPGWQQGTQGPPQAEPTFNPPGEVQNQPQPAQQALPAPALQADATPPDMTGQQPPAAGPVVQIGATPAAEFDPVSHAALMNDAPAQQRLKQISKLVAVVQSGNATSTRLQANISAVSQKLDTLRSAIEKEVKPAERAKAVSLFKGATKELASLQKQRDSYVEKQHQKAVEKLAQLRDEHTKLLQKRAAANMAGPIDPTTGKTLGQQQLGLFTDSRGETVAPTAQTDAASAEMLRAFDDHGIPDEETTQNAGYNEPAGAPTPILAHITKSVARSQQARAASAARWAKKSAASGVPLATPAARLNPTGGSAEVQAIRHANPPAKPASAALVKALTPEPAPPVAPPSPSMEPAPPPPQDMVVPPGVTHPLSAPEPASMEQVAATEIGLSSGQPVTDVPSPPRKPAKRKPLAQQSPQERVMNLLAQGPQPVDKVLATLQDAYSANKDNAAFRLITRLRKAFPNSKKNPLALKVRDVPMSNGFQGIYDPKTDTIMVDLKKAEDVVQAILHEAVHAATIIRMRTNPVVRQQIERIMRDGAEQWEKYGNPPVYGGKDTPAVTGFHSAEEFIAEALTNWEFADHVASLPSADGAQQSIFKRMANTLGHMFGMVEEPKAQPLFERLLDFVSDGSLLPDGDRQAILADLDRLGLAHPAASMFSTFRSALRRSAMQQPGPNGQMPNPPKGRIWKWTLPVWTAEQIARSYGDTSKAYQGPNGPIALPNDTINNWFKFLSRKGEFAAAQRETATKVVDLIRNASEPTNGLQHLDNILVDARMWSLDPSLYDTDPKNVFGINQPGGPALYAELKRQWTTLTDMQRKGFQLIRDTSEAARDDSINQIMLARLRVLAGISAADKMEAYIDHPSRQVVNNTVPEIPITWQKTMTAAEVTAQVKLLGLSPKMEAQAIHQMNEVQHALAKSEGPYVPLRRDGNYMAVVRSDERTETLSQSDYAKKISENRIKHGGDLMVTNDVLLPNGKHEITYRYEIVTSHDTETEAVAARDDATADLASRGITAKDKRAALKAVMTHEIAGVQSASIEAMKAQVRKAMPGAAGDVAIEQINKFYLERLPDTSAKKAQIRARKVAGATRRDMLHVYASHMQGVSYFQAQMRYGHRLAHTIGGGADADIRTLHNAGKTAQANDIQMAVNHFRVREGAANDLAASEIGGKQSAILKLWQRVPALAGAWQLTGLGTVITNGMQPAQVSLPHLGARHGYARATAALAKAYMDITVPVVKETAKEGWRGAGPGGLYRAGKAILKGQEAPSFKDPARPFYKSILANITDKNELAMIEELAHRKKIDMGFTADLQSMSRKEGGGWNAVTYLSDAAFIVPQAVETMNRTVTALATYRLNKANNPGMSEADLHDIAARDVDETQLNYSQENKPTIAKNEALRSALVFKTYAQGMFYTIGRNFSQSFNANDPKERAVARKFLAGYFMTTATFSGIAGIMAFEPLYWATVALLSVFSDDDDPEEALRSALSEYLGDWTDMFVKGVPYGAGIADTSRMGIPTVLPTQELFKAYNKGTDSTKSEWFGIVGETMAGAPGSLMAQVMSGAGYLAKGDYDKAGTAMSPKAFGINDLARAWAYHNSGIKDAQANTVMQPSVTDKVVRALGFTPPEVASLQAKTNAYYRKTKIIQDERSKLTKAFTQAQVNGDVPARNVALKAIKAFNHGHPKWVITRNGLVASVRSGQKGARNVEKYDVNARTPGQREVISELNQEY